MSNRVVIQEGYSMPVAFDGHRRRSRRRGGPVAQQNKMKACAKKWNGKGKYTTFMKSCLKGR
ncbi:MAG: PsiF family protein [Minisyncoccia bacterium]